MPASRKSVTDVWGPSTPYYGQDTWPARVDENSQAEPDEWIQSCCVLCTNGCGLDIGVSNGQIVGVRGRADDPINRGRLGPKGLYGWMANTSPDRLKVPLIRKGKKGSDKFREATWDEAMELIVNNCQETRDKYTS